MFFWRLFKRCRNWFTLVCRYRLSVGTFDGNVFRVFLLINNEERRVDNITTSVCHVQYNIILLLSLRTRRRRRHRPFQLPIHSSFQNKTSLNVPNLTSSVCLSTFSLFSKCISVILTSLEWIRLIAVGISKLHVVNWRGFFFCIDFSLISFIPNKYNKTFPPTISKSSPSIAV